MGIDRDTLEQLCHLLRPLATRIHNTVARAVVQLVEDGKKLQLVQLGVLADETIDGAEHHQPYGFSSVPLAGAEAVVVFPSGDRSHPLVVGVSDRRHRPTGGEAGEVTMYSHTGAVVRMLANGDVEVHPAPGGEVLISDGGAAAALATKADIDALKTWAASHTHSGVTAGGGVSGAPAAAPPAADGTTVLKAQ